jgi:ribokinase
MAHTTSQSSLINGESPQMADVLVAGAINTDLVARVPRAPEAGETITGSSFNIFGGGKGANQTLASARSGAATAILGSLGRDDFGSQRLADLRDEGVETSAIMIRDDAPSGVTLITVEASSGQNRIAYVPGATMTVTPEEARAAVDQLAPRVLLTTLELPAESIAAAIGEVRSRHGLVLLNATPEPEGAARFLGEIDCLIVNEPEAMALLHRRAPADWFAAAEMLRARGPRWVIITIGPEGAVASFEGERIAVPAPVVTVTDTTGAGDALCGAFAAALADGAAPDVALRRGVAAGSVSCTIDGAQRSMPTTRQIDDLMAAVK